MSGTTSIHPLPVPAHPVQGRKGLEPIAAHIGRDDLKGRRSITWIPILTPLDNLESPIHQICLSLDCGRKPKHSEETHTNT